MNTQLIKQESVLIIGKVRYPVSSDVQDMQLFSIKKHLLNSHTKQYVWYIVTMGWSYSTLFVRYFFDAVKHIIMFHLQGRSDMSSVFLGYTFNISHCSKWQFVSTLVCLKHTSSTCQLAHVFAYLHKGAVSISDGPTRQVSRCTCTYNNAGNIWMVHRSWD